MVGAKARGRFDNMKKFMWILIMLGLALTLLSGRADAVTEFVSTIRYGRTISTVSRATNVVTVTLSAAYPNNNLKAGQSIIISGVTNTTFNGKFTIVSVSPSQTIFTYSQVAANAASSGGTAGGDYSLLTTWEASNQCDLTASTTKVFSHGGITGIIADSASVTGLISEATGVVCHASRNQILVKNITGTFQVEQMWVDASKSDYVTLSNIGDSAIVVAECYNDWASGLDDLLTIDGFTTNATNYVKVYTPTSERHDGTVNGPGFYIKSTSSATYVYPIIIGDAYTVIDGIKAYKTSTNWAYGAIITIDGTMVSHQCTIKNCLLIQESGGDSGNALYFEQNWTYAYGPRIYNNIIISNAAALNYGINCDAYSCNDANHQPQIYNNTVYGTFDGAAINIIGYGTADTYRPLVKNNYAVNTGTGSDFTFTAPYSNTLANFAYNASDDGTAGTSNNNQTITAANAKFYNTTYATADLHLQNDSPLNAAGTDLSSLFTTDIDNETRSGLWDIGADETAEQIYRSVGPADTTALATQSSPTASNAMAIDSTGVATFTYALPLNIGVGDVIQYDDGGMATPDQLAFIRGRSSTTQYIVRKADGTLPTATTANSNWAIYRAYTSLFNAEAGIENTGIGTTAAAPLTFRNFDDWTAGGDATTDDLGKNLVAANQQWNIACYADAADTTITVTIDGWTTGAKKYLKIYTPYSANEVGVSQRHQGVWTTNGYRVEAVTDYNAIQIFDNYVRIEGIQMSISATAATIYALYLSGIDAANDIRINSCIIKATSLSAITLYGIYSVDADTILRCYNNIFYNSDNPATSTGVSFTGTNNYIYNNTLYNYATGIYTANNKSLAKNNIVQRANDGFYGTCAVGSDYNISNLASDAPSASYRSGLATTVSFADTTNSNFHLSTSDTMATGVGVDLSADTSLAFSDDIDGGARFAPWSIGADQQAVGVATGVTVGNWDTTSTWASGVVPSATQDVTIAAGKTITFDKNDSTATAQTCRTITVYGTLNIGSTTAGANQTMVVEGDIIVKNGGVLTIRADSSTSYSTTIKFKCGTNAQYGLIVESGGQLDIQGTSKDDPDVIITALTQDSSHNGYIYCMDGSKTKIKFADISYMGAGASGKFGILVIGVNSANETEYFYIQGCKMHHGYAGVYLENSNNCIVDDNSFYGMSYYPVWTVGTASYNLINSNLIYGNSMGIGSSGTNGYNTIKNNVIKSSGIYGITVSEPNDYIYNNNIDASDKGIFIWFANNTVIKNNILTNNATGITDSGTGTVIDYNLFYGNTADGSTGTNAITGQNPNFVSTDSSSVNFMYVAANSPALGAGCRLDTAVAQAQTNIGARLDYVYNTTDAKKFNFLQQAHDDTTCTAGDTITAYTIDLVSDTIQGGVTTTGALYVKFNVSEATITANDQHIGQYLYISSAANKGNYYLIVDSEEAATDTITIFPNLFTGTITAGFNTGDSFSIVDRVYDRDGGVGQRANLYLTKDGTATGPITWNTSGTVIVDARHLRSYGIYGNGMNYNTIQGFVCEHGNSHGIYLVSSSNNNTLSSNKSYSNSSNGICLSGSSNTTLISNNSYFNTNNGIYLGSSSNNNTLSSNNSYSNTSYGISLSGSFNTTLSSNNIYSNSSYGIYFGSSNNTLISNNSYSNTSYGIVLTSSSNNNTLYNNTCIRNSSDGIRLASTSTDNVLRNNLSAYNGGYGIKDEDNLSEPTNSYNDLYANTSGTSYQITEGTGTINIAPNFYGFGGSPTYSSAGASGATQIVLSTPTSWTANQWQGYVLWASKGATAATNIFRRIESNTATVSGTATVSIYSTWPSAMDTTYTYKVIDWSVQAAELLGGGCDINTGDASSATNIGSELGYVKNITDNAEFGLLQAANDAAGCGAGDTVTVYAVSPNRRIE